MRYNNNRKTDIAYCSGFASDFNKALPEAALLTANYNGVTSVWAVGSLILRDLGGCFLSLQNDVLMIHANKIQALHENLRLHI